MAGSESDVSDVVVPIDLEALDLPEPDDGVLEGGGHVTPSAPPLATAELGVEDGSLVFSIENLTDSAGRLQLSTLVENPAALYLTEDAAAAVIGPREKLRIELSPVQVRGLDVESEWMDARVNFDLKLEDGRQEGFPVAVFTEYGASSEPREVVSSGVGIGFPELPLELPESVDKQTSKIACFSHVVQLDGGSEPNLDFVKNPNASIAAANLHIVVTPSVGSSFSRTLDTSGCVSLPRGSLQIRSQLTACNEGEGYCWFGLRSNGTVPSRVINVNTNVSAPVVSVPITMTGNEDVPLQKAYALATNTITRTRALGTGIIPQSNLAIRAGSASRYLHFNNPVIELPSTVMGVRRTVAHETGHWIHQGRFPHDRVNAIPGNVRSYCQNTTLTPCDSTIFDGCTRTANNDHSFNSLEWAGVAHIEGFAHFFTALSYNQKVPGADCMLPDTNGEFKNCEARGLWLYRADNGGACAEVEAGHTNTVSNELDWTKMYWDFFADERASLSQYLAVEASISFNAWQHNNHFELIRSNMSSSMRAAFDRAARGNVTPGSSH